MTVYPNINASLDCFSKEKCSPLLVPCLYTLLTMEWLQLWVCHCVFFTEWELAVMISMSPRACQWWTITVFIHHETSTGSISWSPGQQCWQPSPQSSLRFYGLGLPSAIEANAGYQTEQFMTQPGFDLGPPEMPLLKKCRNLMNGSMFIFMKTWTDFFILDNTGIFCPENMVVLLQVAAQDGSCSTCMGFFKYLFCCLTSDISLAWVVSSFFEFLMQHWSGW